jgi:hypothetical protein
VFSVLTPAAYFTDLHFFCVFACRMVRISMQRGISGASTHGYALLGFILGPVFHRYDEGYRFAKLACDLVEKHGFIAYQAKAYRVMTRVAFWTQPIATAIDFNRAAFRTAMETGDLTSACFCMDRSVTVLILRNDPLDVVWRESEKSLDFIRKAGFRDMADAIVTQQRFIATMQGRTATLSTFSDVHFDEAKFEAQLTADRMTLMICCFYWILKLKARFLSGDFAEALAAADEAKPLLWAVAAQIQSLDYYYYAALTVAALYENASADEQAGWRDLLTAHREQLREWADNNPATFSDKHALVSAEIARLEGRDADAIRLYEQAIKSAREHGFVQNEGRLRDNCAILRRESGRKHRVESSAQRPVLLFALGRARQGAATRASPPMARRGISFLCAERDDRCTCGAVGRRDSGQGFAGGFQRDRAEQAHRDAHENLARACRGRAGPAHSFHGQRAADFRGGDDWRRQH